MNRMMNLRPALSLAIALAGSLACSGTSESPPTNPPPPLDITTIAWRLEITPDSAWISPAPCSGLLPSVRATAGRCLLGGGPYVAVDAGQPTYSAVNAFLPGKQRVTLSLRLRNQLQVYLNGDNTAPVAPVGRLGILVVPVAVTRQPPCIPPDDQMDPCGAVGVASASPDWNGDGSPGSGEPLALLSTLNDARWAVGIYRYETFPDLIQPDDSTAWQDVGFDVDLSLSSHFVAYLVIRAVAAVT
jgi:hypothetical protein